VGGAWDLRQHHGRGRRDEDLTGIKEEVRLSFTFSTGVAGDFVHLVLAAPAWRPYA